MKKYITILFLTFLSICGAFADPSPSPIIADKLQSALSDVINKSVQLAGDAKDFLAGQLPDVIKQLLVWKMAESIGYCALSVFTAIILFFYFRLFFRYGKSIKWDAYEHGEIIPISIFSVVVGAIALISVFVNFNITWLQIWLAPKVYLLDYSRHALGH